MPAFSSTNRPLSWFLSILLAILGFAHLDKWYTAVTFLFSSAFLIFLVVIVKPVFLGRFYVGYLVALIPFLLINGILTGSFIEEQIVWYDNAENLSIRIFTIPIEDSMYMLLMLLMATSIYEAWKKRHNMRTF